ncbi:glycosyltransferase family 4 protein [Noviherbaspirillum sp. Root189]|uniref:glycosyltransferase family 4 protein n=1 Tax=Noviherbaspirillum sp. Root189 TaxID=1736487 RepID=UPI00070E3E60|nr:glycosyltransferase family 4 protein [Noviherbaspirillum sp. Root189]KRB81841.1 hypothetical protein ASE07_24140 [Noviherbaspirillum sp. Root189]
MKKIAMMVTKSEFGGGQEYIRILMSQIANAQFMLVTGDRGYLTEFAGSMNIRVHVCDSLVHPISPRKDLAALTDVYALLRRERPDLVHANSSKAGVIGRAAATLAGIPAVFTAHGWAFTEGVSRRQAQIATVVEKMVAPLAKKIICVSDYDRSLALRKGVGDAAQMVTVHNGIPDIAPPVAPVLNAVPRIVMVARFAAPKDYETLLRAAALFQPQDLRVECVGDGPDLVASRSLAKELGVEDRVIFHGARSDVAALLSDADIFVLLSRWEGLPISILEAMRAGLPVIASRVGGVPEAVEDGVTGILLERNDAGALADALRSLISDPPRRRAMGIHARQRFLAHFSAERMVQQTQQIYAQCTADIHIAPEPHGVGPQVLPQRRK